MFIVSMMYDVDPEGSSRNCQAVTDKHGSPQLQPPAGPGDGTVTITSTAVRIVSVPHCRWLRGASCQALASRLNQHFSSALVHIMRVTVLSPAINPRNICLSCSSFQNYPHHHLNTVPYHESIDPRAHIQHSPSFRRQSGHCSEMPVWLNGGAPLYSTAMMQDVASARLCARRKSVSPCLSASRLTYFTGWGRVYATPCLAPGGDASRSGSIPRFLAISTTTRRNG